LAGIWIIDIEPAADERGFFARTFCADLFKERGLVEQFPQSSVSFNAKKGTLRGLHMQDNPHGEAKLIRCTSGSLFDVAVDLRPGSPTFGQWTATELTAHNRRAIYIPEGCAHGFVTLGDDTEIIYQISRRHVPEAFLGLRWDDPELAIAWPHRVEVISERDASLPRLREVRERAGDR
jgi:dTDP-4-dehydrorhamnose 3,5-epimerase